MLSTLLLQSANTITVQIIFALALTLLLSFLKLPEIFLYGLLSYVHPDDVAAPNNTSSGLKAAIRRPGTYDAAEPNKPRKKPKEKFEFDEQKAQIFRIKLNDSHLRTRRYFNEFSAAFNSTIIALSCLLLHKFQPVSKDLGVLRNGSAVPILLGLVCVCRVALLLAKVSWEGSASKRSERQLSVLLGAIMFLVGLNILFGVVPTCILDFDLDSLDGFGKLSIAIFMGCIAGFLYVPALRNARAFWIGTDQIRCNLSIISGGLFSRMLLYANFLMALFTSLLWVSPFCELLINQNIDGTKGSYLPIRKGHDFKLAGNLGFSRSDFDKFRVWCLLISGILQLVSLRQNVQMFLNEAVLCWYQRLHASKVPQLDYSRAKVFLHNHNLCLAVLQFFGPSALILLFLGLSHTRDDLLTNFRLACSFLPCSALTKELALYMAWFVVFVWATLTSVVLALYRRGIIYVS
ncbi:hypothetical protein Leryth_024491 [Lithospermum erythrorhizon]|nr:hypothetical protein Leryth_024491 [Lithospermum erythrorhizon]